MTESSDHYNHHHIINPLFYHESTRKEFDNGIFLKLIAFMTRVDAISHIFSLSYHNMPEQSIIQQWHRVDLAGVVGENVGACTIENRRSVKGKSPLCFAVVYSLWRHHHLHCSQMRAPDLMYVPYLHYYTTMARVQGGHLS